LANLRALRKRITSIKSTGQITRAMKMVAAAKLRRAQDNIIAARPYADRMRQVAASLAARTGPGHHSLLRVRPVNRAELVVLTSDRGLCGAYNMNVVRAAEGFIKTRAAEFPKLTLTALGKKGRDYFRRRGYDIRKEYLGTAALPEHANAVEIARELIWSYEEEELDLVFLIYSRFVSAMQQRPQIIQLLPLEQLPVEEGTYLPEFIFEPSEKGILDQLLPRYVEVQVYRALLEANASEHAARMTAMGNATKNTEDMVSRLTLEMNKARQATITRELIDIVTGVEAQKR
jgi:F-type H+-transporting ATPase subunit gamma